MTAIEEYIEIPGGKGVAVKVFANQSIRLRNTFGSQVVDTWALSLADPTEYLSVEHTRRVTGHLYTKVGESFLSNRRNPMLKIEEDSFPGTHDMLVACCDRWLYEHYGCQPGHPNCHENFLKATSEAGVENVCVPNPVNLWMNVSVEDEEVKLTSPLSQSGDHVLLKAEMDVLVIFSACPMDITPVNGENRTPRSVHYRIE